MIIFVMDGRQTSTEMFIDSQDERRKKYHLDEPSGRASRRRSRLNAGSVLSSRRRRRRRLPAVKSTTKTTTVIHDGTAPNGVVTTTIVMFERETSRFRFGKYAGTRERNNANTSRANVDFSVLGVCETFTKTGTAVGATEKCARKTNFERPPALRRQAIRPRSLGRTPRNVWARVSRSCRVARRRGVPACDGPTPANSAKPPRWTQTVTAVTRTRKCSRRTTADSPVWPPNASRKKTIDVSARAGHPPASVRASTSLVVSKVGKRESANARKIFLRCWRTSGLRFAEKKNWPVWANSPCVYHPLWYNIVGKMYYVIFRYLCVRKVNIMYRVNTLFTYYCYWSE